MPIVHSCGEFYTTVYQLGKNLSKRDRLGLWSKVETITLETLTNCIKAALQSPTEKAPTIREVRIKTETLKQLIRLANELKIITDQAYLILEIKLEKISKMATGWEKFVTRKPTEAAG